jgi:hypothetical protein
MMETSILDQLKKTEWDRLTQVVRQDLNCPTFELRDWNVRMLSDQGVINPDGLFLVEGHGVDGAHPEPGIQPWRVVVKNYVPPQDEVAPDNLWYWKREVLLFQSGLLERLPGPLRWPRSYGVFETGGSWQIWMEHVKDESPARWTMDHYRLAARELGRWNGRCFQQRIRPAEPWMGRELYRGWVESGAQIPGWRDGSSPSVRKVFLMEDYARACRVFDEREIFFAALNKLPQVFSHFDYNRRNLMIRKNTQGQDEVVAVDWADSGIGPLGGDLYGLIAGSAILNEVQPEDLPALEGAVYPEYLAGLGDEGWDGDPDEIRLAYTAWIGVCLGSMGPALIAASSHPEDAQRVRNLYGFEQEELAANMAKQCRFGLDLADEARDRIEALAAGQRRH